ncbi:MAG: CDF family Co(II)/Ni(II) efflux transporter DmeF [Deltaproteobacteria bacterium]|nr:CDF family Co(II)/Ni(II) efflux transporter DmeF [Deltaproteobacteria bacterium]MBW2207257.1 CDF family Co(II)/Ni(II) efflux transporter DmeF [Deltaproteobacteria bacterium]
MVHIFEIEDHKHKHSFHVDGDGSAERRTYIVILFTLIMMVVEVVGGYIFGSMALLADGWHMGTHAGALGITAFAYAYARRNANNPAFTFGTGKVGVLGGYTSAVILGIVAVIMLWESSKRLVSPVQIHFNEAIVVACIGLVVNLVSAYLLRHPHHQEGGSHEDHHHHPQDHNLKAAYFHVLADALTSVLAIIALFTGKAFGWIWMDPIMGIVGSLIIGRWAYGLVRESSRILLDGETHGHMTQSIRETLESDADNRVSDLHLWRVGPHDFASIITVLTHHPRPPEYYKDLLAEYAELSHITVEIHAYEGVSCVGANKGHANV